MIHVENLTKVYADLRRGKFIALHGIGFEALAGEIFGLLGPNGAGKTTALRVIGTMLRPTSGTVQVNGYDVLTQASEVRHQIGFVSANTGMYDRMTAWEVVEYFGRLYGLAEEPLRARMEELFSRLKMNDIRDVLGAKMSTGMKQKVSIARAIVHDPPVLIFDEATSHLDTATERAIQENLRTAFAGKTVVLVAHRLSTIKDADHIYVLHQGRIAEQGEHRQLIALGGRYAALCHAQTDRAEVGTAHHTAPSLNGHDHHNGHHHRLSTSSTQ